MIGQESLITQLTAKTPQTFPKAMLLIGERGSGRHTLMSKVARKLNFVVKEISKNITTEELIEYQYNPIKTLYIINIEDFIEKQQNQFLKFLEDPAESAHVCIIATAEAGVLPTIINRCQQYYMKPYTLEELKAITGTDHLELAYKVCNTPGKLLSVDISTLVDMYNDCKYLVTGLKNKPFANTLLAANRINYKENYDKYDYYTFFDVLEYVALNALLTASKSQNWQGLLNMYLIVSEYKKNLSFRMAHKENYICSLLSDLWKEAQTWK